MRRSVGTALTMVASLSTVAAAEGVTIVPRPASIEPRAGAFVLRTGSVIVTEPDVAPEAQRLAVALALALGSMPKVVVTRRVGSARRRPHLCPRRLRGRSRCRSWIRFDRSTRADAVAESYELNVAPGFVTIRARDAAGLFAARLGTHLERLTALDVRYFGSAAAGCP
jgi:hypothetical protein